MIASGNVAVILPGCRSDTVLKLQKTAECENRYCSICPLEVDICRLLWSVLGSTGVCQHVIRPIGITKREPACDALELEKLTGLDDKIINLEQLLNNADARDDFPLLFRSLIFQTLFTISMWTFSFGGRFRHNDLHIRNVCFTPWNDAHEPVTADYELLCFPQESGMAFVKRRFRMSTVYRAVIIDHGWSALLPGLGPDKDPRFFSLQAATGKYKDVIESDAGLRNSGMSQNIPCQQYDVALFMYSIFAVSSYLLKRNLVTRWSEELRAFISMYSELYRNVTMNCGRLPVFAQRELQKCKSSVPTAEMVLRHPFFIPFRVSSNDKKPSDVTFGLHSSWRPPSWPSVVAPDASLLAGGKGGWKTTGSFAALVDTCLQIQTGWKFRLTRDMDDVEEHDWCQSQDKETTDFLDLVHCCSPHLPKSPVESEECVCRVSSAVLTPTDTSCLPPVLVTRLHRRVRPRSGNGI